MYFCDEHRGITRYYEILKSSVCEKYQLRQMEYDILMFLYNNPQHNTAADIVRYRKSTKSHVSMSLKVLEEKEDCGHFVFLKEDINYSTSCNAAKFSSPVRTFTTRSTLYTKILPSPI